MVQHGHQGAAAPQRCPAAPPAPTADLPEGVCRGAGTPARPPQQRLAAPLHIEKIWGSSCPGSAAMKRASIHEEAGSVQPRSVG